VTELLLYCVEHVDTRLAKLEQTKHHYGTSPVAHTYVHMYIDSTN